MAKLILAMNVSADGYVDDAAGGLVMPPPGPELFDYWTRHVRDLSGSLYGRRMYETMRYWDGDDPDWSPAFRAFAEAWRRLPKWVVSSTLTEVGPNATLITGDIEAQVRALKKRGRGTISVAGPQIAGRMTKAGLIDEYHLYVLPYVLGGGKAVFHDTAPKLRFLASEQVAEAVHLAYAGG